jgi:hypothetical protein
VLKIQSKIKFGNENLECLINEIIQGKITEVTQKLKNRDSTHYNKDENYSSIKDSVENVDETK